MKIEDELSEQQKFTLMLLYNSLEAIQVAYMNQVKIKPWRAEEIIKQMYLDKGYLKISQAIANEYLFSTKIIITAETEDERKRLMEITNKSV